MIHVACAEAERFLQAYVDRALTVGEIAAVEQHLASCSRCRRCYRFEHVIRAELRRVYDDEPCPEALKLRLRNLCEECDCED